MNIIYLQYNTRHRYQKRWDFFIKMYMYIYTEVGGDYIQFHKFNIQSSVYIEIPIS